MSLHLKPGMTNRETSENSSYEACFDDQKASAIPMSADELDPAVRRQRRSAVGRCPGLGGSNTALKMGARHCPSIRRHFQHLA